MKAVMAKTAPRWDTPTLIQAETLPHVLQARPGELEGRAILGQAINGAGKTGAFCIAALSRVDPNVKSPQIIILEPTNQLVLQTGDEVRELARFMEGVEVRVLQGKLTGAITEQIVVGTEYSVNTAITGGNIRNPKGVHVLVVDEADEMMMDTKGAATVKIRDSIDDNAMVLLFSASLNCLDPVKGDPQARQNADSLLGLPENKNVRQVKQPIAGMSKNVTHFKIPLNPSGPYDKGVEDFKLTYLATLLRKLNRKTIIFVNSNKAVPAVFNGLKERAPDLPIGMVYNVKRLQGALRAATDQTSERIKQRLQQFSEGTISILVATGGLARGINIAGLQVVINYDIPLNPALRWTPDIPKFQHQCGRVGRIGQTESGGGVCVHFISSKREMDGLSEICNYLTLGEHTTEQQPGVGPSGGYVVPNLPGGNKPDTEDATDDAMESILHALKNPPAVQLAGTFQTIVGGDRFGSAGFQAPPQQQQHQGGGGYRGGHGGGGGHHHQHQQQHDGRGPVGASSGYPPQQQQQYQQQQQQPRGGPAPTQQFYAPPHGGRGGQQQQPQPQYGGPPPQPGYGPAGYPAPQQQQQPHQGGGFQFGGPPQQQGGFSFAPGPAAGGPQQQVPGMSSFAFGGPAPSGPPGAQGGFTFGSR